MILLSKTGIITPKQDKTDIALDFKVDENTDIIKIKYSYSPKTVEDRIAAEQAVSSALKKYSADNINACAFLPVNNLVTLSFDENGRYRGACHRQPNVQEITISAKNSTPGIINRPVECGDWRAVLNVHYAGCDIEYKIEIEGVRL